MLPSFKSSFQQAFSRLSPPLVWYQMEDIEEMHIKPENMEKLEYCYGWLNVSCIKHLYGETSCCLLNMLCMSNSPPSE